MHREERQKNNNPQLLQIIQPTNLRAYGKFSIYPVISASLFAAIFAANNSGTHSSLNPSIQLLFELIFPKFVIQIPFAYSQNLARALPVTPCVFQSPANHFPLHLSQWRPHSNSCPCRQVGLSLQTLGKQILSNYLPRVRITARSIQFLNSLILPGHW